MRQAHFEELKVWQKGMDVVRKIYSTTKTFPKDEIYGLTSQIRRAAVSIPVNIAEGKGRKHKKEFIQFLFTARGSAFEVMTLVRIAQDQQYLLEADVQNLLEGLSEISAMLNGLIEALE